MFASKTIYDIEFILFLKDSKNKMFILPKLEFCQFLRQQK